MPRNEGGVRFRIREYAIAALDDEEVDPGVRASPELMVGGVRRDKEKRVRADGIIEVGGVRGVIFILKSPVMMMEGKWGR